MEQMECNNHEDIGQTLSDAQKNLRSKRQAVQAFASEYTKICSGCELNLNQLEDSNMRVYNLDSYLKSIECRIEEYERKDQEWEKETNNMQKTLDELELVYGKEMQLDEEYTTAINERVIQLVKERKKDREVFDNTTADREMENLQESLKAVEQEVIDTKKALEELTLNKPFVLPGEVTCILENINLRKYIQPEIEQSENIKAAKLRTLNDLKKEIQSLEEGINILLTKC